MKPDRRIATVLSMAVILAIGASRPARAEDAAPAADPSPQEVRRKLDDVQAQIAQLEQQKQALEKEAQAAERLAERRRRLADLHGQCRDQIKEAETALADMQARPAPESAERKALVQARQQHWKDRKALNEKILAIEDPSLLEQAEELRVHLDLLGAEWWLVTEPTLEYAATAAELGAHVAEASTQAQRDTLASLRKLQEEELADRRQEFDLIKARQARDKAMQDLGRKFWEQD